ncbi:MAG: DUF3368 domain-containing protein [Saprospiraceae bacterium]|jgi:predicted nucleic acid-binding protein|nr:DUF3368 domain-containing protein [Saprospiraceae bacterium]
MKVIIADTSCLIIYDTINKFDILRNTFTELVVTKEVAMEFGELPDWIKISAFTNDKLFFKLANNLGKGEASSIALALELADSLLIIDEKKGRKKAEELGIEIIGSLGILIIAKKKGVINSVKEILSLIDRTNFRISEAVREKILKETGE